MTTHTCSIIVVGGGPCGLMLANELGRRGVSVFLVDQKAATAFNPQANATQARTMEHFRRLGFADEIRALGLPADFPTDIAYFTRYAGYELARFKLPSAREAKQNVARLAGSWSAAELPHRVSQKFVEATLRKHAETLPGVSINYGWRLTGYADRGDRVEAQIERVDDGETATDARRLSGRRRWAAQHGAAKPRYRLWRRGGRGPGLHGRRDVRDLSARAGVL